MVEHPTSRGDFYRNQRPKNARFYVVATFDDDFGKLFFCGGFDHLSRQHTDFKARSQ